MSEEPDDKARLIKLELIQNRVVTELIPSLQEHLENLTEAHRETQNKLDGLTRAAKAIGATLGVIGGVILWVWQQAKEFYLSGRH